MKRKMRARKDKKDGEKKSEKDRLGEEEEEEMDLELKTINSLLFFIAVKKIQGYDEGT